MKTFYQFFFISAIIITISSCKKTVEDLIFEKSYGELNFTVDTTSQVGYAYLGEVTVPTDINARLEEAGLNINNLKSVSIKSIIIENVNPNQTLNYFRKLEIQLSNSSASNLIFARATLPENTDQRSVTLSPAVDDLKEFFKQESFGFAFYGENDLPIQPEPVALKAKLIFEIKSGLGN